jgi:hypothetical protein
MNVTRTASLLALLSAPLFFSGCAFTDRRVNLVYPPANAAGAQSASVSAPGKDQRSVVLLAFIDQRQQKDRVGEVRNGFGMHTADVLAANNVAEWVTNAVKLELEKAGFAVTIRNARSDAPEDAVLSGEVIKVHCGAYFKYGGEVELAVRLEHRGRTLIQKNYLGKGSAGTNWTGTSKSYGVALSEALQNAIQNLVAELQREINLTPTTTAAPPMVAGSPGPAAVQGTPVLAAGTKLYSNDGTLFGTVVLSTDTSAAVALVGGGTVTMTTDQAIRMQAKKDQVNAAPASTAPVAAPSPAAVVAPQVAAPMRTTAPASKPVPPALAVGTKLFNQDGSLFGAITILGKDAVAVLQANGFSTVTISRDQAVGMQR